ncbi:MAG: alkaline phosphatase family protein, partial [Acidobacteria bacterium]|nr:alkaline phosphatase family protein [Candidatus Sulfomarinibacter kjeldsenii]
VYFRGVDIASHYNWKFVEPEKFGGFREDQIDAGWERVASVYEAIDETVGALERAAQGEVNLFVLSDHGFRAKKSEILRVLLNLDSLLQRLGFLKRNDDGGVDFSRSHFYTYETTSEYLIHRVRFSLQQREPEGRVPPKNRKRLRHRLEAALERVTYANGSPAFRTRDATDEELQSGADFIVEVLTNGAEKPLLVNGRAYHGALSEVSRISGGHGPKTRGVFFAAGPDIDPNSGLELMDVIDTTPTLLYALGLPVADDFAGRVRMELFTERFRDSHELVSIPTWGMTRDGHSLPSAVDEEILQELRALGYLDD